MLIEIIVIAVALVLVVWMAAYMLSQKTVTDAQQLIQARRYADALAAAQRDLDQAPGNIPSLHAKAEALKLLGRFEESLATYGNLLRIEPSDAAAREGLALALAYLRRDLPRARTMMEETLAAYPGIQEFQALALAYILLRSEATPEALRLFEDNKELLETRFRDDYTDADPLLAETLYQFAVLSRAAGDTARADALFAQSQAWGGRSFRSLDEAQ